MEQLQDLSQENIITIPLPLAQRNEELIPTNSNAEMLEQQMYIQC